MIISCTKQAGCNVPGDNGLVDVPSIQSYADWWVLAPHEQDSGTWSQVDWQIETVASRHLAGQKLLVDSENRVNYTAAMWQHFPLASSLTFLIQYVRGSNLFTTHSWSPDPVCWHGCDGRHFLITSIILLFSHSLCNSITPILFKQFIIFVQPFGKTSPY